MAVGAIIIAAILIILSRGARYGGEAVIYLNGEEYARMPLDRADTLKNRAGRRKDKPDRERRARQCAHAQLHLQKSALR